MDGFLASAHPNGIIRIDQIVATDAYVIQMIQCGHWHKHRMQCAILMHLLTLCRHDEPSSVNLASDASYLNPFLS